MIRYKLTNGESDKVSLHVCIHEEHVTTTAAQERLSFLLSVLDTSSSQTPPPSTRKAWTDAEIAVISRAFSPADAYQRYHAAFPDSTRTEYSVIKKYGKLRRGLSDLPKDDPEPTETELALAHHPDMPIAFVEPVSTGNEVTLHDPLPEPEPEPATPPTPPTPRKNAWLPEEDDVVREAPSSEEAARLHGVVFPGKRTPAAIDARWRKLNPSTLQKLKDVASSKTELPERGASVRITGALGPCTGKTGTVIRRDTVIGEVLINLGSQDGCVWVKPEDVEVVSE